MRNTSPFDHAELLNIFDEGLRMSLYAREDVTKWADQFILQDDQPDIFFIDLSLSRTTADCVGIIRHACQNMAAETTIRPLFGALHTLISSGQKTVIEALTSVSGLESSEVMTDQEKVIFSTLVYTVDLVDVAQVTEAELEQDAISFLALYQGYTIENYSRWDILDKEVEKKLSAYRFHGHSDNKADSCGSWWQFWKF